VAGGRWPVVGFCQYAKRHESSLLLDSRCLITLVFTDFNG
jgi:hypothetical protein